MTDESGSASSTTEQGRIGVLPALLLPVAVFVALTAITWWLPATPLNRWQRSHLGWNYSLHVLFLAIPLVAVLVSRSRLGDYGLTWRNWREDLSTGAGLAVLLIALPILAEATFGDLVLRPHIAARGLVNTVTFQLFFVGAGEELLYRGFFQGEFNRLYGRPFALASVHVGPGLLAASFLFGFAHLLNPFNPLTQAFGLDWSMFGTSCVVALVLGVVRERMDGLLTVALLHFGITLFPKMFEVTPVSGTAMLLAWLVTAALLIRALLGGRGAEVPSL